MDTARPIPMEAGDSQHLRHAGLAILIGSSVQLIAAFLPNFEVFTSPDPRVKLQAIAANKLGWRLQALLFPIAFLAVAIGFRRLAAVLPASKACWSAMVAAALSGLSFLLWLPMSVGRMSVASRVDELIHKDDPHVLPDMNGGQGWAFWPYTVLTLGASLAMGVALYGSKVRRRTGALAATLSTLGLIIIPFWRDWPPLLSYVITLALGIGLSIRKSKPLCDRDT